MESPEQPTRDEKEALRLARGLDNEAEVEAYTPRLQSLLRVPRPPIQMKNPRPKTALGANEKKAGTDAPHPKSPKARATTLTAQGQLERGKCSCCAGGSVNEHVRKAWPTARCMQRATPVPRG